ncbi:serine/threonine-protein kinase pim-1-like [Hippoglossus stenolepis]|uniref:serine/threonine-protein kinase pim-1-like n=1 Tax=Hippoglossus stenolepis TaxID=195615 RepID=UPI001FAEAC9B|nr:serine/threonine-protein kinase pim-1-like [Hippoglossus stenolepis]
MDPGDYPHTPALNVASVNGRKRTIGQNGDRPAKKRRLEADDESASCSVDIATTKAVERGRRSEVKRRKKRRIASGVRRKATFEEKYWQLDKLGEGGFGYVFAGFRKSDCLPVAIKHVDKKSLLKPVWLYGKELPAEVAVMLKLAAEKDDSTGMSAPIELLDWYDLGHELILVLERPFHSKDLYNYTVDKGCIRERKAKILMRQLVDAAIGLEKRHIFHSDIKAENILIDIGSRIPEVRLIDFGLSKIVEKKDTIFTTLGGTETHEPPEWFTQYFHRAGPTTVWQLGIVLFEMLHKDDFTTESFLNKTLKMSSKMSKKCYDFLHLCLREDPVLRSTLTELQHHRWLR